MKSNNKSIKKLFWELGTCSQTYFHLLNREFDNPKTCEEQAADPLAGGIYRQGYQCGMIWGASLGIGAEAYRRFENPDQAVAVAIKTSKQVTESFLTKSKSLDCEDITDCDFNSKLSMAKYFFSGGAFSCFNLAEEWASDAIKSASEGMLQEKNEASEKCLSCASIVAKKMGATEEEAIMVAGFAGGIGLTGNACGALAAAIWMKNLESRRNNEKITFSDPNSEDALEKFYVATDYKMLCTEIIGKEFTSVEDHTRYIKNGGCDKLIDTLSRL